MSKGRPLKTKIEWYKHDCKPGKTTQILESLFGNDGFAVWFRLLQILGDTDGHAYDANHKVNWLHLVSVMLVPEDRLTTILETLCDLEAIDSDLWKNSRIIWCQKFVDRLQDLYTKRSGGAPTRPNPVSASETPVSASETPVSASETTKSRVSGTDNPQSRVEERREEESREEKTISGGLSASDGEQAVDNFQTAEPLCILLRDSILADDKKFKVKSWPTWLEEMDRLIRFDGRDPAEIEQVINFSRNDRFWKGVILSAANLREKYSRLLARMRSQAPPERLPPAEQSRQDPLVCAKNIRQTSRNKRWCLLESGDQCELAFTGYCRKWDPLPHVAEQEED